MTFGTHVSEGLPKHHYPVQVAYTLGLCGPFHGSARFYEGRWHSDEPLILELASGFDSSTGDPSEDARLSRNIVTHWREFENLSEEVPLKFAETESGRKRSFIWNVFRFDASGSWLGKVTRTGISSAGDFGFITAPFTAATHDELLAVATFIRHVNAIPRVFSQGTSRRRLAESTATRSAS